MKTFVFLSITTVLLIIGLIWTDTEFHKVTYPHPVSGETVVSTAKEVKE